MEEKSSYKVTSHSFDKIIHSLESEEMVQRDRGTLFELLVTAYLKMNQCMRACLMKFGC